MKRRRLPWEARPVEWVVLAIATLLLILSLFLKP